MKQINNINLEYRGMVLINGHPAKVGSTSTFNGVSHFGIWGYTEDYNKEAFCGWIPAFLCEIPDEKERERIQRRLNW